MLFLFWILSFILVSFLFIVIPFLIGFASFRINKDYKINSMFIIIIIYVLAFIFYRLILEISFIIQFLFHILIVLFYYYGNKMQICVITGNWGANREKII